MNADANPAASGPPRRPPHDAGTADSPGRGVWLILAGLVGLIALATALGTVLRPGVGPIGVPPATPSLPAPVSSAPVPPDGLLTWYEGYRGGPTSTDPMPLSLHGAALTLLIQMKDGVIGFDTPRCLVEGTGTYTMGDDGSWSFDPGALAAARCPGDEAATSYRVLVDTLAHATRWTFTDHDPSILGSFYLVSAEGTTVLLRVATDNSPAGFPPAFGSLAPQPWESSDPSLLVGAWTVTNVQVGGAQYAGLLFDWDVVFTGTRVELPTGCNTGTGDAYLATDDGRWFYGSEGPETLMLCDGASPAAQSEMVHHALLWGRNWALFPVTTSMPDGPCTVEGYDLTITSVHGVNLHSEITLHRGARPGEGGVVPCPSDPVATPQPS